MQGIQSNFDRYTKMMSEQMAEQMRRWEEDMKKREEVLYSSYYVYNINQSTVQPEIRTKFSRYLSGYGDRGSHIIHHHA